MKNIKNELQNIITGNGQIGDKNLIKTIQDVLRRNEKSIQISSQNKLVKSEEEIFLKHIIEAGAKVICPAHGSPFNAEKINLV